MAKWIDSIREKKKAPATLESCVLAREQAKETAEKNHTKISDLWRNELWQRRW